MHQVAMQMCDEAECANQHVNSTDCCDDAMMRYCYGSSLAIGLVEVPVSDTHALISFRSFSLLDDKLREKHDLSLFRPPILI